MGTTAAIIDSTLIADRGSRDKLGREMVKAQLARARTKLRFLMWKSLGGRISLPQVSKKTQPEEFEEE